MTDSGNQKAKSGGSSHLVYSIFSRTITVSNRTNTREISPTIQLAQPKTGIFRWFIENWGPPPKTGIAPWFTGAGFIVCWSILLNWASPSIGILCWCVEVGGPPPKTGIVNWFAESGGPPPNKGRFIEFDCPSANEGTLNSECHLLFFTKLRSDVVEFSIFEVLVVKSKDRSMLL